MKLYLFTFSGYRFKRKILKYDYLIEAKDKREAKKIFAEHMIKDVARYHCSEFNAILLTREKTLALE